MLTENVNIKNAFELEDTILKLLQESQDLREEAMDIDDKRNEIFAVDNNADTTKLDNEFEYLMTESESKRLEAIRYMAKLINENIDQLVDAALNF